DRPGRRLDRNGKQGKTLGLHSASAVRASQSEEQTVVREWNRLFCLKPFGAGEAAAVTGSRSSGFDPAVEPGPDRPATFAKGNRRVHCGQEFAGLRAARRSV